MRNVQFEDLGTIDYQEAWNYQTQLFEQNIQIKMENRSLPKETPVLSTTNYLLFCEHPHVFTLGKSGSPENLLASETLLKQKEATFYKINRGGDITYHGPGQLVAYPIFDLDYFFSDIHKYLRFLEEAVILTLKEYGVEGGRYPGYTGVWIEPEDEWKARKICAMGVKCSRWVTMHGIGFNINTNLDYFQHIVPCGIEGKAVTSLAKETGSKVDMNEVKSKLKVNLSNVFDFDFI